MAGEVILMQGQAARYTHENMLASAASLLKGTAE
jgi:hypothetical protein